ncbi:hypothetical protein OGATHE_000771 [Ogataea polymorpha]|uniref:Uncharacterized protein n=1 Tax=Ogataea polymorpha TaxID=460523 RepID=A0A9P8PS40_9ASCO|nr:hypothetical protein OGATHE_000771 [Ogataea polymorpha]
MAHRRPLPLTSLMTPLDSCLSFSSSPWKNWPSSADLSTSFSSFTTSRASMATREARGLPPYVDPWEPGSRVCMISLEDSTADTGKTPPEMAFPRSTMSGLFSLGK